MQKRPVVKHRLSDLEKAVWFPPVFFLFLVGSAIVTANVGRAHENMIVYSSLEIGVALVAIGIWKIATALLKLGPTVSCGINGLFVAAMITEWNQSMWSFTFSNVGPLWIGLLSGAAIGFCWEGFQSRTTYGQYKEY